jgi:putative PIN family toxin of toxin-antitoxin system
VRVVLDTNTVLSALLFEHGRLAWIRELWTTAKILPLVCAATGKELIAALAYPKFKLSEGDVQILLAAYLPFTEVVDLRDDTVVAVPTCSDSDDQVFLRLAAFGEAKVLVTGDKQILALAPQAPFEIETAAQFRNRFA